MIPRNVRAFGGPIFLIGWLAVGLFFGVVAELWAVEKRVPQAALWRERDGALGPAPPEAEATATSVLVRPNTEGSPAFVLPMRVQAGDVLSVRMRLESLRTEDVLGEEGQAGLVFTVAPKSLRQLGNPGSEHRQIVIIGSEPENIQFAFRAKADYPPGELLLVPRISLFSRTVRLEELAIINHGAKADPAALTNAMTSYPGQRPNAPWRAQAARQITQHRMADLRVVVTDRYGHPLPNALVTIEQLRHAYPFGTAVVASRIVDAPRTFDPGSSPTREQWLADNRRYRDELLRNFNTVVLENDLKWPQWSYSNRVPGRFSQSWTLDALEWLRENNFLIKGHTLLWGSWVNTPYWLRELEKDPEALQKAALAHIRDIGEATADFTSYWDVLNEPMSHHNVIDLVGLDKVAEWFKVSRAVLPHTRLVMNEFDMVGNGGNPKRRANFLAFYEELKKRDAPMDVIGFQGHFWSDRFTPPEEIWRIIDEVNGATGLPLMISEFDTNVPNEKLQADYTRDFLTAWFAHPATEAFIMWGFWGGSHWMGEAGAMFRTDWTPKPNLAAYRDLVYGKWWTRATQSTDGEGTVVVRAFLGRHRLSVHPPEGQGLPVARIVELPKEGRVVHVVIPQERPALPSAEE